MGTFGNQGGGFNAGTNWGNPYGGRYYSSSGAKAGSETSSPLDEIANLIYASGTGGTSLDSTRSPDSGTFIGASGTSLYVSGCYEAA